MSVFNEVVGNMLNEEQLPLLTGTKRSVLWANMLRRNALECIKVFNVEKQMIIVDKKALPYKISPEVLVGKKITELIIENNIELQATVEEMWEAIYYVFTTQTEAVFWIEQRFFKAAEDKIKYFIRLYREQNRVKRMEDERIC